MMHGKFKCTGISQRIDDDVNKYTFHQVFESEVKLDDEFSQTWGCELIMNINNDEVKKNLSLGSIIHIDFRVE